METYDSSNMQQSEREESECIRETKGEEEKERELETINYPLYFGLTIYCFCIELCRARFGNRPFQRGLGRRATFLEDGG